VRLEQVGEQVPDELAAAVAANDERIFSAIRERLGLDQAEWVCSGGAPIPVEVLEFFTALGLPIRELWGMSETSCCATINPRDAIRIGTVGKALARASSCASPPTASG
jgi:long-subunit acyl-CoA synthetase (AMP-forming)